MFDKLLRALLAEPVLLIALAVPLMSLAVVGLALLLSFEPVRRWIGAKVLALRNALLILKALFKTPSLPRLSLRRSRKQTSAAPVRVSLPPKRNAVAAPPPNLELRRQQTIIDNLVVEAARQAGGHRTLGWLKKYLADSGIPESRVPYFRQLLIDRGVPLREDAQASPDAEPAQAPGPEVVAALPAPPTTEPSPAPSPPVEKPAPKPATPAPAPQNPRQKEVQELVSYLEQALKGALMDNLPITPTVLAEYGYTMEQAKAILGWLKKEKRLQHDGKPPARSGEMYIKSLLDHVRYEFPLNLLHPEEEPQPQ